MSPPGCPGRAIVVGGDEAAVFVETAAPVDSVDHPAVRDDGAGGVRVAFVVVRDAGLPADRAGGRVEGDHVRVRRGDEDQVLPDGQRPELALASALGQAPAVLPERGAVPGVKRLHDVPRVAEEQDAVAHQGGLLAPSVLHPPAPGQLQPVDIGGVDLGERAVAPRAGVPAPVEPVAAGRVGELGVRGRIEPAERTIPPRDARRAFENLADLQRRPVNRVR